MTVMTERMIGPSPTSDLVCLSHLRWNFVFQRPQHLMTRFAAERRVFFVEEPILDAARSHLDIREDRGVHVVVPHVSPHLAPQARVSTLRRLIARMLAELEIENPICW